MCSVIIVLLQLQIKLSSVQLARKYMRRVASELDAMNEPEKEPNREFLVLQGVRFAFRIHQVYFNFILSKRKRKHLHADNKTLNLFYLKNVIVFKNIRSVADVLELICFQFAGGFDAESMKAFEELRSRVNNTPQIGDDNKQEA